MSQRLSISRIKATASGMEPVVARLALETLAGELAENPPGLPPQAVLIVQKLAMQINPQALAGMPDVATRARFAHQGRQALAAAAASAAKPAYGTVPATAQAVLFADESEMLACLARDGLAGRLEAWWWRAVLGRDYPNWALAFAQRPAAVPGAMRLLAKAGLAQPAALELANHGRWIGIELAPLSRHGESSKNLDQAGPLAQARPPAANGSSRVQASRTEDASTEAAQVAPFIPTASPLAIGKAPPPSGPTPGLAARTQPSKYRTETEPSPGAKPSGLTPQPAPSDTLHRAVSVKADGKVQPYTPVCADGGPVLSLSQADRFVIGLSQQTTAMAKNGHGIEAEARPEPNRIPTQSGEPSSLATAELLQGHPLNLTSKPGRPTGQAEATHFGQPPVIAETTPKPPISALTSEEEGQTTEWAYPSLAVDSAYGGAFFLVNVLLGDGLYPDFTRPLDPGFPVPLWRLLALLSGRLAGKAVQADPLWNLLDRLASGWPAREEDSLEPWPVPKLTRTHHHQPSPCRHPSQPRRPRTRPDPDRLAHWLWRYAASVRGRFAQAFDLPAIAAGRFVIARPARIFASAGEIVVVHALDRHPVEIRLAGLDRDPGFLPSVGQQLSFVFI